MSRVPLLPKWVLPSVSSIYDLESATLSEMVPKLYGAMRNMIEDYNKFADEINAEIETYTESGSNSIQEIRESVERRLICKFNDLDSRFGAIKMELAAYAEKYLQENVQGSLPIVSAADNGKFLQAQDGKWIPVSPAFVYDPETESLTFVTTGGE